MGSGMGTAPVTSTGLMKHECRGGEHLLAARRSCKLHASDYKGHASVVPVIERPSQRHACHCMIMPLLWYAHN
eukprot:1156524-Pelagomonas_calceolata.AAC.5